MSALHLHLIQTFREVVEQQSFSAAAKRLGLTQPAVSFQMRQLEDRLGVRLISRAGRRSVPTKAGSEFLRHAETITSAVLAALEDMSRYNVKRSVGKLRLATDPSAGFLLPPSFWRELRLKLPDLDMQVHSWETSEIIKAIDDDLLDLGLVNLPPSSRDIEVCSIIQDELVLTAPITDTRLPQKLTPSALEALPLLIYEPGGEMHRIVQGWFSRGGHHLAPLMEIGDIEAIKQLVAQGLGYAILPSMAIPQKERDAFTLRRLSPRLHRKLALIVKPDRPSNHFVQQTIAVFDSLASVLRPDGVDFPGDALER